MAEIDAEHLIFDCPSCDRQTDIENSLCRDCEEQLRRLLRRVDKTIQWLTIMGEMEARQIARDGNDTNRFAATGQAVNLTPASLVADEIECLVKNAVNIVQQTGYNSPLLFPRGFAFWEKPQFSGKYLTQSIRFIARQPWASALLNGFVDVHGNEVRGLKTLINEADAKWPTPDQVESPRWLENVPCPACGLPNLYLHPVSQFREPITIVCGTEDAGNRCGWQCPEDAQTWLATLAALEQAIIAEQKRKPNRAD